MTQVGMKRKSDTTLGIKFQEKKMQINAAAL